MSRAGSLRRGVGEHGAALKPSEQDDDERHEYRSCILHAATGKETTLTALVVDTGCYVSHNTKGEKHTPCATACAKAGVPVALLEEGSGTLYLPIATDHKNPNVRFMPFIEKRVKVTGSVVEKGGLKGLAVKTIEAAK